MSLWDTPRCARRRFQGRHVQPPRNRRAKPGDRAFPTVSCRGSPAFEAVPPISGGCRAAIVAVLHLSDNTSGGRQRARGVSPRTVLGRSLAAGPRRVRSRHPGCQLMASSSICGSSNNAAILRASVVLPAPEVPTTTIRIRPSPGFDRQTLTDPAQRGG